MGGTGFYEDYYANEEVSVSALGADVEMNSGGAAIVTTIKSGGNTFRGLEHLSYEPGSFVGSNAAPDDIQQDGYSCPNNAEGQPQCDNPNLLFWEGHLDLGGPIKRDVAWFYGAYNHFKIDKQVAGISRDVATDLGIFDNYTAKGTVKMGQNNTLIGYFQQGRKQKPKRGLSTLLPPESVRAQDSYSRMYKGEYQRVVSDRTFFSVIVGNFTLDWPMEVQVDPAQRPPQVFRSTNAVGGCRLDCVQHLSQEAAAQDAVDALPAQQGRQPRLQVRVRGVRGLVSLRSQRALRADPLLVCRRRREPVAGSHSVHRHRRPRRATAPTGPWARRRIGTMPATPRIAGRRTTTSRSRIGVRLDYQKVGYGDAIRKPLITDGDLSRRRRTSPPTRWSRTPTSRPGSASPTT